MLNARERHSSPSSKESSDLFLTAFAAGALVFPGGAVDPADLTLAARHGGDLALDEAAARMAAARASSVMLACSLSLVRSRARRLGRPYLG